jgi:glycosyltransferase involved in cell wall biosynthesis
LISQAQSLVTIGIPLYNEEKYIEEALRSAASQCGTVLVSDNASTDGSAAICEAVSREYPNIHFVRQPHNMGSLVNFKFLLDLADTPYFMWLGSHDSLPDGYVRQLTQLLEDCPEAVLAYGASRHVDLNGKSVRDYDYKYHAMLADKVATTRIMGLIRHLYNCSLVHGIFRTEALREAWKASVLEPFLGGDHVLLTDAATRGPFLYASDTYLIRRDAHPADTQHELLKRIDPRQTGSERISYREMQRRQYALASSVSRGTGLSGFLYRLKARAELVKRFGPFGDTFMTRKLDRLIPLLSSPLPDMLLYVFKMMRQGFAYRAHKFKRTIKSNGKPPIGK